MKTNLTWLGSNSRLGDQKHSTSVETRSTAKLSLKRQSYCLGILLAGSLCLFRGNMSPMFKKIGVLSLLLAVAVSAVSGKHHDGGVPYMPNTTFSANTRHSGQNNSLTVRTNGVAVGQLAACRLQLMPLWQTTLSCWRACSKVDWMPMRDTMGRLCLTTTQMTLFCIGHLFTHRLLASRQDLCFLTPSHFLRLVGSYHIRRRR